MRTSNGSWYSELYQQRRKNGKKTNYGVFRLNKIKLADGGAVKGRIKHSWREHGDTSLDKSKCEYIHGKTAEQIFSNYKKNLSTLTKSPRSNSVGCLEVVITCSKDSIKDESAFFNDSVKALRKQFGRENLVGVALHRDESSPHIHAFITPIQTMEDGSKKLNAKEWTGGKQKMVELQNFFHREVFSKHGLARGEPSELTNRKNQRARLTQRENLVKGREEALRVKEKKIAIAEKNLAPKLEALRTVENLPKFSPKLEALPLSQLPVKKVFESAQKIAEKTAEKTLEFAQKQYRILHKAYQDVAKAIGAEKIMRHAAEQEVLALNRIVDGVTKELDSAKKLINGMTPNQAEKLASEMRKNNCQNYGELNQKIHEKKQEEILRQKHEKAQERAKTRKRESGMGYER